MDLIYERLLDLYHSHLSEWSFLKVLLVAPEALAPRPSVGSLQGESLYYISLCYKTPSENHLSFPGGSVKVVNKNITLNLVKLVVLSLIDVI